MAVASKFQDTDRLQVHFIESGPETGAPVLMVHGSLTTGRFFDDVMDATPSDYRFIARDMRAFGETEAVPVNATWDRSDEAHGLVGAWVSKSPFLDRPDSKPPVLLIHAGADIVVSDTSAWDMGVLG